MKRIGFLFESITDFENLLLAFQRALVGKRRKREIQKIYFNLEDELFQLQEELVTGRYRLLPYHIFTIYDPKQRQIAAPRFRDHWVAHAIHRVIYPIVDKILIHDTYGSRVSKGPEKAILRAQKFSLCEKWFLKLDISRYFASVDHSVLMDQLERKFKDRKLLKLFEVILSASIPYHEKGCGIALGHLSSQILANFYLNGLDHFIKDQLKVHSYLRYMDDMLLMGSSKKEMKNAWKEVEGYLQDQLNLSLKENFTILSPLSQGMPYLGFLIFPNLIRIRNKALQQCRKTLKRLEGGYLAGMLSDFELQQSVTGLVEHIKKADSHKLRVKWLSRRPVDA